MARRQRALKPTALRRTARSLRIARGRERLAMPTLTMSASSKMHSHRHGGRMGQPRQDRRAELQSRTAASRPPASRSTSASVRSVATNPRPPSFSGGGTALCKAGRMRGMPGLPLCGHCFRTERQLPGRASSTSRRKTFAVFVLGMRLGARGSPDEASEQRDEMRTRRLRGTFFQHRRYASDAPGVDALGAVARKCHLSSG
jgi:hypothetical protein